MISAPYAPKREADGLANHFNQRYGTNVYVVPHKKYGWGVKNASTDTEPLYPEGYNVYLSNRETHHIPVIPQ